VDLSIYEFQAINVKVVNLKQDLIQMLHQLINRCLIINLWPGMVLDLVKESRFKVFFNYLDLILPEITLLIFL